MTRTVVGLFKSYQAAEKVKQDFIQQGLATSNDIEILGQDELMQRAGANSVVEDSKATGIGATIGNFFRSFTGAGAEDEKQYSKAVNSGKAFLAISVPESRIDAVAALLEEHGAENVDEEADGELTVASSLNHQDKTLDEGGTQRLDVVEEELQVGKRRVQRGGVRVYSRVTEHPVEEQITLREEHVHVERRPVDRAATGAEFDAFQEGTIELTESAEQVVVSKQSRVVEEVLVGKTVSEHQETVRDTVRRTDVEVEEIVADGSKKTRTAS